MLVALSAATLLFRFWLAAVLPMTGDEAYFYEWGWQPDWGFYDHPPMVGWWLATLLMVSDSEWWLRLPSVLQPVLLAAAVAFALPRLWPEVSPQRRDAITALILLAPINVWNVLITTDTPLVFFSVLSGLAWLRAAQERDGDDLRWYLLAGLFLAGAVLSKYFVALLGFAYLLDTLRRRSLRAWAGLAVCYVCCVPALGLMAWWNAGNCWPNFMFNFVNRHQGSIGWSLRTPLLYAVTVAYALTPPVIWLALRRDPGPGRAASADFSMPLRSLAMLAGVPFVLFALLSGPKQIGLHWLLSFIPFVMIWVGLRASEGALRKLLKFLLGFAVLHAVVFVTLSLLPLETWNRLKAYDGIVLTVERQAMKEALAADLADADKRWTLAMDGYSNAVTLGYNLRRYVIVFGEGSSHARHDDILTDFRALDGGNILIVRKREPEPAFYQPYFANSAVDSFEIRGVRFWRIRGEGFRYVQYRDQVLSKIRNNYYRIPSLLPQCACYFCDRYFPGEACVK